MHLTPGLEDPRAYDCRDRAPPYSRMAVWAGSL
eukprot:COSAG01_NODE_1848_length_9066_cov_6.023754_7_plen_33_part_00